MNFKIGQDKLTGALDANVDNGSKGTRTTGARDKDFQTVQPVTGEIKPNLAFNFSQKLAKILAKPKKQPKPKAFIYSKIQN
jgi:hypothetical protein